MDKVSVNIPTYNRAHFIRHALDSVLRQTYPNVEIVVIDDGSTDGTRAVVAEYGDRVRYFHQPNRGLGAARNAGLEHSTGQYIAFLDSDDEWLDFKLALQVEAFERLPNVGFLFSEFIILKDDGTRIGRGSRTWLSSSIDWAGIYSVRQSAAALGFRTPTPLADFHIHVDRLYRQLLHEALILPTTAIVRRDAIGSLRFTEGMLVFEDWEFFARLSQRHAAAFLEIETAINRGHEGPERMTRAGSLVRARRYLKMLERVWLADTAFQERVGPELRTRLSNAILAVAREALLASQPDLAREMLRRHHDVVGDAGRSRAVAYAILASLPSGRHILKNALLTRKLVKSMVTRHGSAPVNPAA